MSAARVAAFGLLGAGLAVFAGWAVARTTGRASFHLARESIGVGDRPFVEFDRLPDPRKGERYWITSVPRGAPDRDWGLWRYVDEGAASVELAALPAPGIYEVRLHARYPTRATNVVFRRNVRVEGEATGGAAAADRPTAALAASDRGDAGDLPTMVTIAVEPSVVRPGERFRISFSEALPAAGGRYWVTVIAGAAPDEQWGPYQYVEAGARHASLHAPSEGEYEVRLHDHYPREHYHVVHRVPITVRRDG